MDEIREAIHLWIKEDAPVSVKMSLTNDKVELLIARMEQTINKIKYDCYDNGYNDGYSEGLDYTWD